MAAEDQDGGWTEVRRRRLGMRGAANTHPGGGRDRSTRDAPHRHPFQRAERTGARAGPDAHPRGVGVRERSIRRWSRVHGNRSRYETAVGGTRRDPGSRAPRSTDPNFTMKTRTMHRLLKAAHHLSNVTDAEPPPLIAKMTLKLLSAITPASPNDAVLTLIKTNADRWRDETVRVLEDHYRSIIEQDMQSLTQMTGGDWHQNFDIAVAWSRRHLGRRLRQTTVDETRLMLTQTLGETTDQQQASQPEPGGARQQPPRLQLRDAGVQTQSEEELRAAPTTEMVAMETASTAEPAAGETTPKAEQTVADAASTTEPVAMEMADTTMDPEPEQQLDQETTEGSSTPPSSLSFSPLLSSPPPPPLSSSSSPFPSPSPHPSASPSPFSPPSSHSSPASSSTWEPQQAPCKEKVNLSEDFLCDLIAEELRAARCRGTRGQLRIQKQLCRIK